MPAQILYLNVAARRWITKARANRQMAADWIKAGYPENAVSWIESAARADALALDAARMNDLSFPQDFILASPARTSALPDDPRGPAPSAAISFFPSFATKGGVA